MAQAGGWHCRLSRGGGLCGGRQAKLLPSSGQQQHHFTAHGCESDVRDVQTEMHRVQPWTFACCVVDEARVLVCAMMVEEFGLGGLVGLCGSHRSCLASSRRQQRVLHIATTSLHAYYKPHNIGIPRVYRGSIHPASDKCRPRMSSRSLFSAPTTSHEDMKTAAFQQKATLHGEQHLMAPARCLQKGSIRWNYLQHPSRRESQVAAACDSYHNRLHQGLTIMQTL